MKTIELSRGMVTQVDDSDFEILNQWKWSYSNGYAVRCIWVGRGKLNKMLPMHRQITDPPLNTVVDHIDGNRLNNQRSNLRITTRTSNMHNTRTRSTNKSGFQGVHFHKGTRRWRAQICSFGKTIHVGYFPTPKEASEAWKQKAVETRGILPYEYVNS